MTILNTSARDPFFSSDLIASQLTPITERSFNPLSEGGKSLSPNEVKVITATVQSSIEHSLAAIRKHCCTLFPNNKRLTPKHPLKYYLNFDEQGDLTSISCPPKKMGLSDYQRKNQALQHKEGKASLKVFTQFIHFAVMDGEYPIKPVIELKPIYPLTPAQAQRIDQLNEAIKQTMQTISQANDLTEQVEQCLANHYNKHQKQIVATRGGETYVTPDAKAYLIFFRAKAEFQMMTTSLILIKNREENSLQAS